MRASSNSARSPEARRRAERHGHWAEALALFALRMKGYRLLARRFKTPQGEIDLIMRRGRVTAFIEVKQRRHADDALEAVAPWQERRISDAAQFWFMRDPKALETDCRFDIVTVGPYQWPQHFPNAYESRD